MLRFGLLALSLVATQNITTAEADAQRRGSKSKTSSHAEPAKKARSGQSYDAYGGRASSVYYRNCSAARAAGAAPVRVGDPGYASHLDRDNDGVGCE